MHRQDVAAEDRAVWRGAAWFGMPAKRRASAVAGRRMRTTAHPADVAIDSRKATRDSASMAP